MKSITLASGTLVTCDDVAASLLDYMARVSPTAKSVSVDIPVLETDGSVSTHTIVLNAAVSLDVANAGDEAGDETERFPVPSFPIADDAMIAVIPTQYANDDADDYNRASAEIDRVLDGGDDS